MGFERRNGPIDYKGYGQKKKKNAVNLIRLFGGLILVFSVGWVLLQLFDSGEKATLLAEEPTLNEGFFLDRKNIYDRNLQPLAVSFCQYAAYVKPLEVKHKQETALKLAQLLGLDEKGLFARLNTERAYIWLGQQFKSEQARQLLEMNLAGVYLQEKSVRYYPNGQTMAQMLGYVKDGKGLAGVELYYDGLLTGGIGNADVRQGSRPIFETGKHVVLTIDLNIQTGLEKAMVQLLRKTEATSVSAMAVATETGAILASVQLPSFDPNRFWEGHPQSQQLRMVSSLIDTGGVSSLFRYAAAVDGGRSLSTDTVHDESPVIIKPTLMKSGSRSRAGYWWPWAGGGYISDELTELPDPTISASELLRFQQKLGISCADDFDFPDSGTPRGKCEEGQLNGVSLLGGFTRFVNGGKPIYLHTLGGTVTADGKFANYEFAARGENIGGVSMMLGQSFAVNAGDGATLFAVEYLSPKAQEDAVTVESETSRGENRVAVLQKEFRHDGLLLGAIPAQSPKVTVLVIVEEGKFDLKSASPLRNIMNRFSKQIAFDGLVQSNHTGQQIDPAMLKNKFEGLMASMNSVKQPDQDETAQLMPNVQGLSLRKALVVLQPYMLTIEISGAGRVMSQIPESGAEIQGKAVLVLGGQDK